MFFLMLHSKCFCILLGLVKVKLHCILSRFHTTNDLKYVHTCVLKRKQTSICTIYIQISLFNSCGKICFYYYMYIVYLKYNNNFFFSCRFFCSTDTYACTMCCIWFKEKCAVYVNEINTCISNIHIS